MTTEVSMRPCSGRGASATRGDVLAGDPVEICSELVELHPRSAPERGDGRLGADKPMPAQRGKLADGDSVPGHDERLALVKLAHDVAAVIAQLPLGDLFGHAPHRSTSATGFIRDLQLRTSFADTFQPYYAATPPA